MDADRERTLLEDWRQLTRVSSVFTRYPLTFVVLVLLATGVATLMTLSQVPVYRSDVTLKVEDLNARNPVLDDLNIPTGTTKAQDAVVDIASVELVRRVVESPSDGAIAHPGHREYDVHMGLTTVVEDAGLGTLAGTLTELFADRSPDFRLFAAIDANAPGTVERERASADLRVQFLTDTRVSVSVPEDAHGTLALPGTSVVTEYVPEGPIVLGGLTLRLLAQGIPDDRVFRIRRLSVDDAIRRLQARLSVYAPPDSEGVVRLTVTDTSRERSAEVANALANSYADFDEKTTLRRAEDIVRYIANELADRGVEVAEYEREIESIYKANPDWLDTNRAFAKLSDLHATFGIRLGEIRSLRTSLESIHESLRAGDKAMASRLGVGLSDPMTRKYLDYIAQLEEERLRVSSHNTGDYQKMLELKHTDAVEAFRQAEGALQTIRTVIVDLANGETGALSRLGRAPLPAGFVRVDQITLQYASDYLNLEKEVGELEGEFTEKYGPIEIKRDQMARTLQSIFQHVRAQEDAAQLEVDQRATVVSDWAALIESRPKDERERIDMALATFWTRVQANITARIAGLMQQEGELRAEHAGFAARLALLPEAARRLAEPQRKKRSLEKVVGDLERKREMADIAVSGLVSSVRVVNPAVTPTDRESPTAPIGIVVGVLLGSIVAFGTCLAHERFRGRMRGAADYEGLVGVSLMGTLGSDPDGRPEIADDAFRSLRARLRNAERESPLRTIGITSSIAGEGKTETNVGLAIAYGMEGRRVLLVDANLRAPSLHESFALESGPGLAESLDGRKHWMQCTRPSGTGRVDVLVAGEFYYPPADMLSGVRMTSFLREVCAEYDVVVIDLPAVAGSPDTECVGPLLDGVLLLCDESHGPTRRVVQATIDRLRATGTHLIGAVRRPKRAAGIGRSRTHRMNCRMDRKGPARKPHSA